MSNTVRADVDSDSLVPLGALDSAINADGHLISMMMLQNIVRDFCVGVVSTFVIFLVVWGGTAFAIYRL
jgi:hypothetical protein